MATPVPTTDYSEPVRQAIAGASQRYVHPWSYTASVATASPILRRHFTVANEARSLQMPAWSDYLSRSLDVPVARSQVAHGFHGEIDTYVLKDLVFLDSRTDPVMQTRTAARISTDNVRDFIFHVAMEGIVEIEAGATWRRKTTQFMPGIVALDMGQPLRMRRPTRARVMAFFVPRGIVEASFPDASALHGQVVTYTSPIACMLREQLIAIGHHLSAMDDHTAQATLYRCIKLILAAFGQNIHRGHSLRVAAQTAMLERVKEYIHTNLGSPALAPQTILSHFPLTRPTLYRMFEHEGGLYAYIRNCRLREAAHALSASRATSVAQIASRFGFSYPSDFTRAFRRAYGQSPMDFRSMALEWWHDNNDGLRPV
ncbi:MAG TPA: helix-turn-helix domain-containing protein [Dyella sp.]|uniref:helix-turn-helix domain-containing protein n=1 Tax=Dyella sp. TaxID=1869338 RepID=UPI002F94271D